MNVRSESERTKVTLTIAAGATGLSDAARVGGFTIGGAIIGSSWVAAGLDFYVSDEYDGTYVPLNDDVTNARVSIPAVSATTAYAFNYNSLNFAPWHFIKVRSATAGSAVNQTGGATVTLVLKA